MKGRIDPLAYACSECGAASGAHCIGDVGLAHYKVHAARLAQHRISFDRAISKMSTRVGPKIKNLEMTKNCARGAHAPVCTGLLRSQHGQRYTCQCPCHKVKS